MLSLDGQSFARPAQVSPVGRGNRHGAAGMIGPMRAVQVLTTTGPGDVVVREVDEPVPGEHEVLVEVHAIGVSFPDLLLSKGQYQMKPEPPFTLGVDVAGTVVSGPGFERGQRVAGVVPYGGAGERAVVRAVS